MDFLSNLPLSIIHEILARVQVIEAIRTTVLSKQWRYTWTTLPHLVFNYDGLYLLQIDEDELMDEYRESIENFISNVLLHHKGPIHSFEIVSTMVDINNDSVEKWVLCLSRKDIRELSIRMDRDENDMLKNLSSSIYSCVKLTKLKLVTLTFLPAPSSFKGFLALTTLDLCDIELDSDELESLVACCPLLETLNMFGCSCEELRLHSPNLKNLVLFGGDYVKLCLYAPLLAIMEVGHANIPCTLSHNYTNLLGCFTNLVNLTLYQFTENLSIGIESCQNTLVLHHLRVIELNRVDFADIAELSVIVRLINGAPNLQKLVLDCTEHSLEAPCVSFEDIGCEPNFTLEKLREVCFYFVCDHLFGMHFIKLLLESSPVLETVNLNHISKKAAAELLGFRRSSTNARILVSIED